jgi:uncharacterized protein with FMN-binding domain
MHRSVPVAAMAAAGLLPPVAGPLLATADAASGRLVVGDTYNMKWGAVTVQIRLAAHGKRILNVGANLPTERPRSARINDHAAPILKREVLKAQTARIHAVSGATMTSKAYVLSLRSALSKAH